MIYCIQGKNLSHLFPPLLLSLSTGKFRTEQITMSHIIPLLTQLPGRIHDRAKLLGSVDGRKLHEAKIILFTVNVQFLKFITKMLYHYYKILLNAKKYFNLFEHKSINFLPN